MPNERTVRHTIASLLLGAIVFVGGRTLPRILTGRATVVEREAVRETFRFLSGTAPSSALTTFIYGLAAAYGVIGSMASPDAFQVLVLPYLGGAFLQFVIPFAIGNLVVLKGVVGMTSGHRQHARFAGDRCARSGRPASGGDGLRAAGAGADHHRAGAGRARRVCGVFRRVAGLVAHRGHGVHGIRHRLRLERHLRRDAAHAGETRHHGNGHVDHQRLFCRMGAKAEQGFVGRITTSAVATAVFSSTVVNLFLSLLTAAFRLE